MDFLMLLAFGSRDVHMIIVGGRRVEGRSQQTPY